MSIRCQSFSTAKEPGGLKYFTTAGDTEFNELAWTVGAGELPPGLEEAMMGMHRNGLRRIILPGTQVFSARNENQLPLPTTKDGKRLYERLFKTEASLLFEVLVTRIKNP
jgi:FKBP-type peptidyl-prolyl cis-trans isomerase 2